MENPQYSTINTSSLPITTMYQYNTGRNIKWGNNQYKTPKEYLDPLAQVLSRKYAEQKKGEKDRKYLTKRGHYMEYDQKIAKSIPSSAVHNKNQPWNVDHLQKFSKHRNVDQKLIKNTYLQQIQINQQKRKVPGVCAYSLQKSIKQKQLQIQKEKKRKKMQEQRRFFHQDIQFLGNVSPGSGNYNPHDQIQKIRKDKNDWKFWVQKHKKFSQMLFKRDSVKPNSCSYNPMNMTLDTFDRLSVSPKNKTKVPGFGTSARFNYQMPQKKKIKQIRPSPAHYKTSLEWRNKNQSPRFKPWNTAIWKGKQFSTISVYD